MVGERGALEGTEPHHRSRENGLEHSDILSNGIDIYKNVFIKNTHRDPDSIKGGWLVS